MSHLTSLLAISISRHSAIEKTHLLLQLRAVQVGVGQPHHHNCPGFISVSFVLQG